MFNAPLWELGNVPMSTLAPSQTLSAVTLRSFEPCWADTIASWVVGDAELRLLAPGTHPPLTPEKVIGWVKPQGRAATGWIHGETQPIAYGEINPMQHRRGHFWLGHVVVHPCFRRRGLGVAFVRELVYHTFEDGHARKVALIVFPNNTAAIECYLSAGFRLVAPERHQFRPDTPEEELLRLEITPQRCARMMDDHRR